MWCDEFVSPVAVCHTLFPGRRFFILGCKKRVVQLVIDDRLYFMKYVVSRFLLPQWVVVTMDDRDGLVKSVCSEKLLHYHVS